MSSFVRTYGLFALLAAALLGTACGGDEEKDPVAAAPEIVSFLAAPETIEAGQSATLTWETRNAATVAIRDGLGVSLSDGTLAAAGSLEVEPLENSVYTLEAVNEAGKTVTREVSVTVEPLPAAPTIDSFVASPDAVGAGEETTLSWSTTGADEITIVDGTGRRLDLGDAVAASGSVTVEIARDATFTLTARNRGGANSASTQVAMVAKPQAVVTAPAEPVLPGGNATLSWSTIDAQRVVLTDDRGATLVDATDRPTGSVTVTVDATTRYTLRATGIGGESVSTTEVRVRPVIERFAVVGDQAVRSGDEVTLTWAIRGATTARLSNNAGSSIELALGDLQAGTAALPAGPDGAFFLRVTSGSLEATAIATAPITTAPRIRSFAASTPEVSARHDIPGSLTISWLVDGASTLQLIAEPGGLIPLGGTSLRSATIDVAITEETTFRLVAQNESGSAESTTLVAVVPAPTIAEFRASPVRVGAGEGVPLIWNVADATSIRIERDGTDIGVDPTLVTGTVEDPIFTDATYLLKAYNRLGYEIVSAPVAVAVGDPLVTSFTVDRPVIPAGQTLTFSWANVGGRTLNLIDSTDTVVFTTSDADEIASGSTAIASPLIDGSHDYTLQVINGVGGTDTATVPVQVIGGPLVTSFAASSATATLGDTVTFTWAVDNDAQGRTPTLALVDDLGNVYDVSASDPNNGTATITPVAAGATSFTLTASTPNTTSSSESVPVVVYGVPVIGSLAVDPSVVDTQNGTIPATTTLSWTTQHGMQLEVFSLQSGSPVSVYSTFSVADIASGNTVLQPVAGPNDYLVVVTNGDGATAEGTVSVFVDPAQITQFGANPTQVLLGESTELSWITNGATHVELTPASPSVTIGTEPFIDISSSSTATLVPVSSDDTGYAAITFPSTFTFPWYGSNKTALRAMTDGFISFNMSASSLITNYALPRTSSSNVHISPFWDDMHVRGTGQIWWDTGSDAEGAYLIVMWKNYQFYTTADNPADLNFEAILRANGDVEFRYGGMGAVDSPRANAAEATIGVQNETGTIGYTLSYNTEVPTGLGGKSVRMGFSMPLAGSWSVAPSVDTTYTLTASNAHSSDSEQISVQVFPPVVVATAVEPAEPQAGAPFTIEWTASNATDIRVLDAQGVERCVATASELVIGSCAITEAAVGPYLYTVRAVGQIARDVQEIPVAVQVYSPLSIDSFALSPDSVAVGGSSTLSWATTGAGSMYLTANGAPVDLTGLSMAADSIVVSPTVTTEYVLTISETGRSRVESRVLNVRTASVSSVTTSSAQIPAGGSVTIDWASSGGSGAYVSGNMPAAPATDVSSTVAFTDISTSTTATSLSLTSTTGYADLELPAGFSFPYFGEAYGRLRVFAYGYLSFFPGADATSSNNPFPYSGANAGTMVHIAPFHDSLSAQTTGSLWVDHGSDAEGRYVIIQWKNFQFSLSTYNPADLNFQVVLRENGVFEYRYGAMTGNGTTSYDRYADGYSAAGGFQSVFAQQGHSIFSAPSTPTPLDNKAWRFDLRQPATGSLTVSPTQTTTYQVCNSNLGYTECRDVTVVVVKQGDLMISELMVTPAGAGTDPAGQWIELRNTTPYAIDVSGFTLTSGTETATISSGTPLVVPPGDFLVLSRTAGVANADWSYGTAITLDPADSLAVAYGTVQLDSVTWDTATWSIPTGATLKLDPTGFNRQVASNDNRAAWCVSTSLYDGANAGTPGTLGNGCLSTTYDIDPAAAPAFVDITETGTRLGEIDAYNTYEQIPGGLAFSFPLFGDTIAAGTPITVGSSGWLGFAALSSGYVTNANIPTTGLPNGVVAPFWDALYFQSFSTAHYEYQTIGGQNVLIVQWNNARESTSSGGGRITFQAQLWQNGDVTFAYREVEGPALYFGTSATIGLENVGGTAASVYSYGSSTTGTERIWAGQTIHFRRK